MPPADISVLDPWQEFLQRGLLGADPFVANAAVSVSAISVGAESVPLVTNRDGRSACSWVASLRNAYGPYARAETDLVEMHPLLRPLYLAGSHAAELVLVGSGLAGGNYLNNWLLSTNLYSPGFDATSILAALDSLCRAEPELPVVIRSLNAAFHSDLLTKLVEAGFLLLPSRQIWLLQDPANGHWRKHRDSRRDLQLAESSEDRWRWVSAEDFTARDYARALELYERLYRERYPAFNPDYTTTFLRTGVTTGFLDLVGLRPSEGGELSGVVGMVHRAGVSSTPFLGYDLAAPSSLGLYRQLVLRAFLTAEKKRTHLHCSSGAGMFKFSRGALPQVEFAAVWANHLPLYRRAGLRVLSATIRACVVPYLESHRL